MKKSLFLTVISLFMAVAVHAQKFALVDMEYILGNIPAYEQANKQIESASKQWQAEVDKLAQEAKQLFSAYQAKVETMSKAERQKSEEAVIAKEKAASDLRRKYFGPEGELQKKQQQLLQPPKTRSMKRLKPSLPAAAMPPLSTVPRPAAYFLPAPTSTSAMRYWTKWDIIINSFHN